MPSENHEYVSYYALEFIKDNVETWQAQGPGQFYFLGPMRPLELRRKA